MANAKPDGKEKSGSFAKKFVSILILLLIAVVSGAFIYLNVRKNEISEELLLRVNRNFPGEFTVGSIQVDDLFSYPDLEFTVNDLRFWESKSDAGNRRNLIIDVPAASFRADLTDVLNNKFNINHLELTGPELFIERDSSGIQIISKAFAPLNKEKNPDSVKAVVNVDHIRMSGGQVTIIDRTSGLTIPILITELSGDFHLQGDFISGSVDALVPGQELLDGFGIKTKDFDVKVKGDYDLDLEQRRLQVNSPLMKVDANEFDLDLFLDYRDQNVLELDVQSLDGGLSLENLLNSEQDSVRENSELAFEGKVRFNSHVKWVPQSDVSFLESLELNFSLEGDDLKLQGADLDQFIDNFRRSQNFNLADVSAVMFAGPAGLAITKGSDYASLAFASKGDSTQVRKFLAQWTLQGGRLETRDVALSTLRNRISVDGNFNMVNDSLLFNFHVLDKKGCEMVGQKVYGTASKVETGQVNLIKTFLGPVKNFFYDLGMVKCDIVYEGKVEHPASRKRGK